MGGRRFTARSGWHIVQSWDSGRHVYPLADYLGDEHADSIATAVQAHGGVLWRDDVAPPDVAAAGLEWSPGGFLDARDLYIQKVRGETHGRKSGEDFYLARGIALIAESADEADWPPSDHPLAEVYDFYGAAAEVVVTITLGDD